MFLGGNGTTGAEQVATSQAHGSETTGLPGNSPTMLKRPISGLQLFRPGNWLLWVLSLLICLIPIRLTNKCINQRGEISIDSQIYYHWVVAGHARGSANTSSVLVKICRWNHFQSLGSCVSSSAVSDSLQPHGLYPTRFLSPWDFPSKNTGMGSHSLLQGIFQLRDRTCISCTESRFFTVPASREALSHLVGVESEQWVSDSSIGAGQRDVWSDAFSSVALKTSLRWLTTLARCLPWRIQGTLHPGWGLETHVWLPTPLLPPCMISARLQCKTSGSSFSVKFSGFFDCPCLAQSQGYIYNSVSQGSFISR